jgi:hypothetical protein
VGHRHGRAHASGGGSGGRPGNAGFVGGLHTVAIVVAALFASAAVASLVAIPQQR